MEPGPALPFASPTACGPTWPARREPSRTTPTAGSICRTIKAAGLDIRYTPGTQLVNDRTGNLEPWIIFLLLAVTATHSPPTWRLPLCAGRCTQAGLIRLGKARGRIV